MSVKPKGVSVRREVGNSRHVTMHMWACVLPIRCMTRIWMKWWLSKQSHSPSFHLPSHWKPVWAAKAEKQLLSGFLERGVEIGRLGSRRGIWQDVRLFLLEARIWERFMGKGLSTWLQDSGVNPGLYVLIVQRHCEKGRGGNSWIFICGGERESPTPYWKATLIWHLEIQCLDKPMTMNRRKKKPELN